MMMTRCLSADTAMYRAKEQGRNTFRFYAAEMNLRALERLTLENALRHALERNELLLYYQPSVELRDGRIAGAEALLRWRHPEWGLIAPARFIPLAEETGLILPIGEWVLRAACEQAQMWQDQGISPLRVAVNLSARQFQQPDLAGLVGRTLAQAGLQASCLELEITESLLMNDLESAVTTLRTLKAMGVQFAIDDFGTGYSSLSYLKRLPLDRLKIDRSFVCDITTDPDDAAIAQAVISLAQSMHLRVTAEGVETVSQLEFLRVRQCSEMQGFYCSPPVPAQELTLLLRRLHCPRFD
jgi:EAL domain-containing protein (putative c-di-GMP-specific phosphodiesterase class I)